MKKIVILAMVTGAILAIPLTSDAAIVLSLRRQRVVQVVRVQKVVAVQQVFAPVAVFQPVQAISFVPLVQPVYGQYQAPAQLQAPQRITEKVDPVTGRVIERIIER